MSNPPTVPVPAAIKALTVLLSVLALVQLGVGAVMIFGGMMSAATGGGRGQYVGVAFGVALIPCAIVSIIAIFTLRRRSRMMRIAVTVSSLITIAVAVFVVISIVSYQGPDAAFTASMVMYVLVLYSIPLLVIFAMPLAVLLVLWTAPSARAFFKVSPPRV